MIIITMMMMIITINNDNYYYYYIDVTRRKKIKKNYFIDTNSPLDSKRFNVALRSSKSIHKTHHPHTPIPYTQRMPKHAPSRASRNTFLDHLRRQILDLHPDAVRRRTTSGRLHVMHSTEVFRDRFRALLIVTEEPLSSYYKHKKK